MKSERKVYKWIQKQWVLTAFQCLKKNDIFMMEESTGEVVKGAHGYSIFIALGEPFLNENNIPTILIEDLENIPIAE